MNIWLDDKRDPEEHRPGEKWRWVMNADRAIGYLRTGKVERISLDNDLGDFGPPDGYHVLDWLEEQVATGAWKRALPVITVHSANPVARERMEKVIERLIHYDLS